MQHHGGSELWLAETGAIERAEDNSVAELFARIGKRLRPANSRRPESALR